MIVTIFDSIFDNSTNKFLDCNLKQFENLFMNLSKEKGYKPKKGENVNGATKLLSPARYFFNSKRRNSNVCAWSGWCALDIDNIEVSLEDSLSLFSDYYYICYSTASSTRENPKFRIVLPTTNEIKKNEISHFWFALNTEFNQIGDKQCKDLSRMYYAPATYPDAYNFIFKNDKFSFLDPKSLMEKHQWVKPNSNIEFPKELREKIDKYQREKCTNTSISWSHYSDCPFVNKEHIAEYQCITDTGWYSKMYQIAVSIAARATKMGYPITEKQIAELCRQIDKDTGNWYKNRPFERESARALNYVLTTKK